MSVFKILTVFHSVRIAMEKISSSTGAVPIATAERKSLITLEDGWVDNN